MYYDSLSFYAEKIQREKVMERENAETAEKDRTSELSILELRQAEELWIQAVQTNSFVEELKFLSSNKVSTPLTYVSQFGLYVDEQSLIRCAGRIKNAHLPNSSKCPVLLPKNHQFSHTRSPSSNKSQRNEGRPYNPQVRPDLLSCRVDEAMPFTHTGLDFLGPLYVTKKSDAQDAISSEKTYICLYTCASTRAIHLELTPNLTVPSFLRSFRIFVSRFGLPATLISDNAKTFTSASHEVKNIRSVEVQHHLTNQGVNWQFIVERAPWWGGFWERMVRTVKGVLKKVIGRSSLNYDELYTILTEVESIMNDRPITYIYDDVESISYALSPSQLVYGRRLTSTPKHTTLPCREAAREVPITTAQRSSES
ncbi:integrase core domain [Paramuricea clavata]|uniref:Integrase core domain n=1 Tax=Paramuricea clavata TaxID=317549 RepID=A0A6S7IEJ1_PARCT|nr:integrase core domain [Paramuricea clavata]